MLQSTCILSVGVIDQMGMSYFGLFSKRLICKPLGLVCLLIIPGNVNEEGHVQSVTTVKVEVWRCRDSHVKRLDCNIFL